MAEFNPPLPGQVAPVRTVWYDLDRLAELRDRHQVLIEKARTARAAVAEAARTLASARSTAGTHPAAIEALSKPIAELSQLTVADMAALQISSRDIQQIQFGEKRLARLTAEVESLRIQMAQSNEFVSRLEAYAKAKNL